MGNPIRYNPIARVNGTYVSLITSIEPLANSLDSLTPDGDFLTTSITSIDAITPSEDSLTTSTDSLTLSVGSLSINVVDSLANSIDSIGIASPLTTSTESLANSGYSSLASSTDSLPVDRPQSPVSESATPRQRNLFSLGRFYLSHQDEKTAIGYFAQAIELDRHYIRDITHLFSRQPALIHFGLLAALEHNLTCNNLDARLDLQLYLYTQNTASTFATIAFEMAKAYLAPHTWFYDPIAAIYWLTLAIHRDPEQALLIITEVLCILRDETLPLIPTLRYSLQRSLFDIISEFAVAPTDLTDIRAIAHCLNTNVNLSQSPYLGALFILCLHNAITRLNPALDTTLRAVLATIQLEDEDEQSEDEDDDGYLDNWNNNSDGRQLETDENQNPYTRQDANDQGSIYIFPPGPLR